MAERFGVGLKTAFTQILRVMVYLLSIAPNIIKFPDDLEEEADNFEEVQTEINYL